MGLRVKVLKVSVQVVKQKRKQESEWGDDTENEDGDTG
jgi:hypothetical protein